MLICGRFEGVDERIIAARGLEEISIGDYVLSGGEIAAMVVLDACVRLLPGVMGKEALGDRGEFRGGASRISALYPPARMGGPRNPRSAAFRRPRENQGLARGGSAEDHARATAGFAQAAVSRASRMRWFHQRCHGRFGSALQVFDPGCDLQLEGPITVIATGRGVSTAFAPLLLRDSAAAGYGLSLRS